MPEQNEKINRAWDFLTELKRIDKMIDEVNLDYTETLLRAQPKGRAYNATGSFNPHNMTGSEVEEISVELMELDKNRKRLIKKYAKHKAEFYHIANWMHTAEYIDVLVRFFSKNQKMEKIAEDMNYSRAWVYKTRTRAIAEFAEYMED